MTTSCDGLLTDICKAEQGDEGKSNAHPMQVLVRPLSSTDGSATAVLTNSHATVDNIISSYCVLKEVPYNPKLVLFDDRKRALNRFSTVNSLGIRNGQNLFIGHKNDDPSRLNKKWPFFVSILAFVLGVIGVCVLSIMYSKSGGVYPLDHAVVMDAGSSKTNVFEYHWNGGKNKGTGIVFQGATCNAPGGIADMNPMKLDEVFECAGNVTRTIDPTIRPKTPLYFAATAGMRLLNITDPEKVSQILDQLNNHLNGTELSVKTVEIISGQDEGLYAWITVNFLAKTLEVEQKINPWTPTTLGALDMGGASMQIAFAVPSANISINEITSLQLFGQNHHIFSRTNLCFGRQEANRRYRALLVKDSNETNVNDPCSPTGFSATVKGKDLFDQPCTQSLKFKEWIEKDSGILERSYNFVGTSDYKSCISSVANLLDDKLCSDMEFKECFKKLSNAPDNQKYMAFATYWFTTDFLKIADSSLKEYENVTKTYCQKTWDQIQNATKNSYAAQYCFNAQYIHEVLINGFYFNNETWKNLEFVGEIDHNDVGWTLGYMINATNFLPKTKPSEKFISAASVGISLLLLALLVIASAVFLVHVRCRNKKSDPITITESHYGGTS